MTFGKEKGKGIPNRGSTLFWRKTLSQIFQVASDILKQMTCWVDDELKYDFCQDSGYLDFLSYCGLMCVLCPVSCQVFFPP